MSTMPDTVGPEPKNWYVEHAKGRRSCRCSIKTPDAACDVGEALFRLRSAILRDWPTSPLDRRRRR